MCSVSIAPMVLAQSAQEPVVEPQVDRREIRIPKINVDDIEIGGYTGVLSVEDFGSSSVRGWRLAYHLTEDFFVEATGGATTVSDEAFRRLGIPIFRQPETDLEYYQLSVGYNLFPGEIFLGKSWAMTSAVYLTAGTGRVTFNNEDTPAFNFGIGIRVLPLDWVAIRVEMRDLLFESDVLGRNEIKHNFELTLGLSAYF